LQSSDAGIAAIVPVAAVSVGINLVKARRLVLYDMLWNPVHNKQVGAR